MQKLTAKDVLVEMTLRSPRRARHYWKLKSSAINRWTGVGWRTAGKTGSERRETAFDKTIAGEYPDYQRKISATREA